MKYFFYMNWKKLILEMVPDTPLLFVSNLITSNHIELQWVSTLAPHTHIHTAAHTHAQSAHVRTHHTLMHNHTATSLMCCVNVICECDFCEHGLYECELFECVRERVDVGVGWVCDVCVCVSE